MNMNNPADAKFMGESLLGHAREICRYAKTFCEPSVANMLIAEGQREKFVRTVGRMIREMDKLMAMAAEKGATRFCNSEQIEAFMAEARLAAAAAAPLLQRQPQQQCNN